MKPTEITSEKLRRSISDTFKRVAYAGESFVVTIHGKPVGKIVPIDETKDAEPRKAKPKN